MYSVLLGNCGMAKMTSEEMEELGRKLDSIPTKKVTTLEKEYKEYNTMWNKYNIKNDQ